MTQPNTPAYRTLEFNALDPQTRRRFIEALNGSGSPRPILSAPSSTGGAIFGWALLASLGIAGLLGLAVFQFGTVHGYRQPYVFLLGYGFCSYLSAWAILRAVRTAQLAQTIPFKRGRYVFPTDMVIATDSRLEIVPMGRLLKLDGVHRHVNGIYQGTDLNFQFEGFGREHFTVRGKELAEQIMDDLRYAQQRISEAIQFQDMQVLAAMDVFFEARITDAWNDAAAAERAARTPSGENIAKPLGAILQKAAVVSLGAIALAPVLFFARNFASDEAAFASAQRRNTTFAFQAYLADDGRHAQEVIDQHLPEAAFAEAQRAGTVEALRDFVRAHPESARVEEARAAIHERFVQVRQDFMNQAATGDPQMPVFMGRLLEWLEAHDSPPVTVRFVAPSAEALNMIDQNLDLLGEVQEVTGGIAPVAPHFTATRSAGREAHITQVLQRGFSPVFPSDILRLEHAGRADSSQAEGTISQPVFDVSYGVRPSGSVYTSDTSSRGFVGIHVDFHIQMRFPDSESTWGFDSSVEPPEHFTVNTGYGDALGGSEYRDGIVYSVMADRAFDQLGNQLGLTFFRPDTPAYAQAQAAAERDMRGNDSRARRPGLPNIPGLDPALLDALNDPTY